ncbi:hypothetical protein VTO73DRAFT_4333 [Trametes versicolor]
MTHPQRAMVTLTSPRELERIPSPIGAHNSSERQPAPMAPPVAFYVIEDAIVPSDGLDSPSGSVKLL